MYEISYLDLYFIHLRSAWQLGYKYEISCNILDLYDISFRFNGRMELDELIKKINKIILPIELKKDNIDLEKLSEEQIRLNIYEYLFIKYGVNDNYENMIKIENQRLYNSCISYTEIFYYLLYEYEDLIMPKIIKLIPENILEICEKYLGRISKEKCYIAETESLKNFMVYFLYSNFNDDEAKNYYKDDIDYVKNGMVYRFINDIIELSKKIYTMD